MGKVRQEPDLAAQLHRRRRHELDRGNGRTSTLLASLPPGFDAGEGPMKI